MKYVFMWHIIYIYIYLDSASLMADILAHMNTVFVLILVIGEMYFWTGVMFFVLFQ